MKKIEWIGNGIGVVLTIAQTNQIFQIISLIFTIISTLTATAYTLWCWYKKTIVDQKIDQNEIKECVNIIEESIDKIKDNIEENQDGNNN